MNYDEIIKECERVMERANEIMSIDAEVSSSLWWNAYNRFVAAVKAKGQAKGIHYTNCGSVDLRLEPCHN